jgi:hypothetical protein
LRSNSERRTSAGTRMFVRARDRRGAEQPRRRRGRSDSGAPDSPVFCGFAAKNAPNRTVR